MLKIRVADPDPDFFCIHENHGTGSCWIRPGFFKILFKNRRTDQIKKNWFSQKIPTKTKAIKQLKLNFTKKIFLL